MTKTLVDQGATETLVAFMPKGFVTESANPATHWLAKTLVDQGATEKLVALTPKGIVAKSAIPSSVIHYKLGSL